jgi:carbamoyl-phosphate synthase large subunit
MSRLKKCILVTGIGGNVGQGIIRIINGCYNDIKVIGTNISDFSAGNHLVDVFYKVPFSYEDNYIEEIKQIVLHEGVDLIIPSTDFEAYYLTMSRHEINCKIASPEFEATKIYLDKYLTYQIHTKYGLPFAESCLPSEFYGQFDPAIAKPRTGRGSRGIIKYIKSANGLSDEEYIIQKLYIGVEVTTAIYVSYISKMLCGLITMERTLENGATTYCKVVNSYNDKITEIVQRMLKVVDFKGSFNVQSIVSVDNEIHPFEINCRISGTNSIRHHFGFKDVKYTIDELLYSKVPETISISEGVAYRYLADVIYTSFPVSGNNTDKFTIF